ncbi:MAG: hypothetical protein E6Q88_02510 [Lysobacteraceae bacterium]|nr:MAG: hypothetical protein E6Q88_02510 [Xanthomonadaceae bacterium]
MTTAGCGSPWLGRILALRLEGRGTDTETNPMRKLLVSLTAAMVLGGCTSDWDSSRQVSTPDAAPPPTTGANQTPVAPPKRAGYAAAPDRGSLFAYERDRQPVRNGAFTQHPVQLSEAHALNAAVPGGRIKMQTPSGQTLSLAYERHEENIDGNWTWVGRTADGLEAVITFGADAVFGRFTQNGTEPLRLTMSGGRSWLVETDPTKVLDGNLRRSADEPDVLVPPRLAAAISERKQVASAAPSIAGDVETAASNGSNTIDVVLGYTNGLVTKYGGVSQANTRLVNLMALTNQAYVNSRIDPRVRLVRTVQVAYTDTNSNEVALEAVTGVTCTPTACNSQPVPTELVPLRTARDEYGGDLVSIVRPFRTPEQDGCGIAWLLGGGGFTIDNTDAPFGYSVVSDGTDVDEGDGRTYFCREETLAHELGHNMGQAHNLEDSSSQGTHTYSYGYREATTTGFYTVMAYRLASSSQFPINYFANPSVNYLDTGRPTGTATADNARSLNQSMPLVAQFRATVVPFPNRIRNDFNGDGKSDIVLWNPSISYLAYWIMNGPVYTGASGFGIASGYEPVTTGYLSNIANASLVARNTTTRTLSSYIWNNTTHAQGIIGNYGDGWVLIGQGDVNGDGKDDLFWRFPANGLFAFWLMDGPVYLGGQTYSPPATFTVAGIDDFNGDGRADLLWNNPATRSSSIWLSTGNGFDARVIGDYGASWSIVGTGDVSGDGKADILLRSTDNIYLAYWRMDGAVYQGSSAFGSPTDQTVHTTGDYDGDGLNDVLLTRNSDRMLFMWRSTGTAFNQSQVGQYPTGWTIMK